MDSVFLFGHKGMKYNFTRLLDLFVQTTSRSTHANHKTDHKQNYYRSFLYQYKLRLHLIWKKTPSEDFLEDFFEVVWKTSSNMVNMRLNNVILEASSIELRESLLEPHCFPELQSLIATTLLLLSRLVSWSLLHVQESRNRVSNAIAVSVTADLRTQSFVATGGPSWLSHTILSEAQAM
ncbi:hypothetical protein YC2023_033093 [Brassica napus]